MNTKSPSMSSSNAMFSLVVALFITRAAAQQPDRSGVPNGFEIVGNSGVSAQMLFLGAPNKVYILDKTENHELQVAGHPAWATEYSLDDDTIRPMDILTNSFCAGGGVLGNGTWLNVGGNQAVTYGGDTAPSQNGGPPYENWDGGRSIRLLTPCNDNDACEWVDLPQGMPTRRWYPTLESIEDGSLIIIGGNQWGGFVNAVGQNNPTYEFYPPRGEPIGLNILTTTLPANLFPLTWLLPSGNLFIQTNWGTEIFDYKANVEYPLADIPHAVRTYPASGGSVMLPLTPDNDYTATVMFCGGSDLEPDQWVEDWAIGQYPADSTCVKMSPDVSDQWEDDDSLPEGRTLGSMILLPDQRVLMLNGANTGVAGYGNATWAIGHSYADSPIRTPVIYDPSAPSGSRWNRDGLQDSTVNRMYHSSATLLPDGSVFVSGSNPNPDVVLGSQYPTEYRVERFYPSYFDKRRPEPQGLPDTLSYGGNYFNVSLSAEDLNNDVVNIKKAKAVVIRPGFSTHAINMSQRLVELRTSYTAAEDGSAVLHVSQMPDNPAIFPPGPGMLFITVDGVPSIAQWVMVGSGVIEDQPVADVQALPESSIPEDIDHPEDDGNKDDDSSASTTLLNSSLVGLCSALIAFMVYM